MTAEPVALDLRIAGTDYRIACPPEEREGLVAAAEHLDRTLAEIKAQGRVHGIDRVAVMAGLHIAYELMECRARGAALGDLTTGRARRLLQKIESVLSKTEAEQV